MVGRNLCEILCCQHRTDIMDPSGSICKFNNRGPRIDPCGTPYEMVLILTTSNSKSPTATEKDPTLRHEDSQSRTRHPKPKCLMHFRSITLSTVSKAALISRSTNTVNTKFVVVRADFKIIYNSRQGCFNTRLALKSVW